ncbi:MAG TPA: clostripain-related cysteine peptidase [Anaerolineales bacterium]|nr:clostripain-related cysteine peptidase [Anaerolineales bacterium]
MRKLQFPASLLMVFMLLVTLTCTASAAPPAANAKWTVMVYVSGDNNLESYVVGDIETELAAIPASNTEVQVVALADRGPGYDTSRGDWTQTLLYEITTGITADEDSAVDDWGERNMGDPQTLVDFVTWTKANHPADHYALYFWGHGWSWHPGWVMEDDTDGDTLDYHEMKTAIPSLGFIDVVGYDGCNMSSMEIFDLWHGYATAVTSSQEWVGGEGIQYEIVLDQLEATPSMTADQVAIATSESASADKTWSAVAVDARFDELVDAVDDWSAALQAGIGANRKKYDQAFTATRSFWQAPMDKDLYDMAYEIHRLVNNQTIRNNSQRVMAAVDAVVLHERHVNAYADAHGITIYHISKASQKDDDYEYYRSTVDFALDTGGVEIGDVYAK